MEFRVEEELLASDPNEQLNLRSAGCLRMDFGEGRDQRTGECRNAGKKGSWVALAIVLPLNPKPVYGHTSYG